LRHRGILPKTGDTAARPRATVLIVCIFVGFLLLLLLLLLW
jgi:hypothetical protein